ncbi:MAG: ABC transporter substrate-binding protein [Lachnospiraceae bacterium]
MKKRMLKRVLQQVVLGLSLSTVSGAFAQELDTENPIKIGYVGALSGDTALWGQAGLNGMELTAKQINEDGGILGREVQGHWSGWKRRTG